MKTRAVAVCVVLALVGCNKKDPLAWQAQARAEIEPVIERHRDAAAATLRAIQAAGEAAMAQPPVTADAGGPLPGGLSLTDLAGTGEGNVLLVNGERAAALGTRAGGAIAIDVAPGSKLALLYRFTHDGWQDAGESPESLEARYRALSRLTHVLVVRVRVTTPSSATTVDGELRFVPGEAEGDAQLYELASGTRVGGFGFAIEQAARATVDVLGDNHALARDLERAFHHDVRAELARRFTALGTRRRPAP